MDNNRKLLFGLNRYQRLLFLPAIVSFFVGCICAWLCLVYFILGDFKTNEDMMLIRSFIPVALISLILVLIALVYWMCRVTSDVVGAYDRIVKEMDETLDGKRNEPLHVRPRDEMFGEIVKRFNTLSQKIKN